MAAIYPFCGTRYDPAVAGAVEHLVAPPFDVISPVERSALLARSGHNVVALTLPEALEDRNKFQVSASLIDSWLAEGVFTLDEKPCLYVYEHHFEVEGRKLSRRGFFAALDIPESGELVRGHENTIAGPKQDRLDLLAETRAFLGPIFMLYPDKNGEVAEVLTEADGEPCVDITIGDERHRVTALDDETVHASIRDLLLKETFVIADGHHRYGASVLNYENAPDKGDGGCWARRTLVFCVSSTDPGLVIMPAHRLVHGLKQDPKEYLGVLKECALVEKVSCLGEALKRLGGDGHVFGACIAGLDSYYVIEMSRDKNSERIDVEVLHDMLDDVFEGEDGLSLTYDHSAMGGVRAVQDGRAQMCFFLVGVKPDELLRYAAAGRMMPPKATYFYPKPLTGLVVKTHR